jgi:hypothetical protein
MAIKTVHQRVKDGFDESHEFGDAYLGHVLTSWSQIQNSLRRTATVVVLLMAAFFLIGSSEPDTQLTLGPLKFDSTGPVLALIPTLISFVGFDLFALQAASIRYQHLRSALIETLYPRLAQNDLEHALSPPTIALWGTSPWRQMRSAERDWVTRALFNTEAILSLGLAFGALVFLGYAYWWLFAKVAISDALVAASLLFATFNVVRAVLLMRDEYTAGAFA